MLSKRQRLGRCTSALLLDAVHQQAYEVESAVKHAYATPTSKTVRRGRKTGEHMKTFEETVIPPATARWEATSVPT